MFKRAKTLLKKLFKRRKVVFAFSPKIKVEQRVPSKDELALGWAFGYDEKTDEKVYQLKGINQKYRETHFYTIGASGTGKTKFLEYLIKQDIKNGEGFGVIDPHGDLIEDVKVDSIFIPAKL